MRQQHCATAIRVTVDFARTLEGAQALALEGARALALDGAQASPLDMASESGAAGSKAASWLSGGVPDPDRGVPGEAVCWRGGVPGRRALARGDEVAAVDGSATA